MSQPRIKLNEKFAKEPRYYCDLHRKQLGYLVCPHIYDDFEKVARVTPPTVEKFGQILCKIEEHEEKDLVEICCVCALEEGYINELPTLPT